MSPAMFRELMVPRYARTTRLLRNHGVTTNILDCDGSIHQLFPLAGSRSTACSRSVAHTDAFRLRKEFGDLLLLGGLDKRALIGGKRRSTGSWNVFSLCPGRPLHSAWITGYLRTYRWRTIDTTWTKERLFTAR
jgi:hypothetical protein